MTKILHVDIIIKSSYSELSKSKLFNDDIIKFCSVIYETEQKNARNKTLKTCLFFFFFGH